MIENVCEFEIVGLVHTKQVSAHIDELLRSPRSEDLCCGKFGDISKDESFNAKIVMIRRPLP